MDKRAEQRRHARQQLQQQYEKAAEQRARDAEEAARQKLQQEEKERIARLEARRREKQESIKRARLQEERREQFRLQLVQATAHHRCAIMKHYGFAPWQRLMSKQIRNEQLAIHHRDMQVLRVCLRAMYGEALKRRRRLMGEAAARYGHVIIVQRTLITLIEWEERKQSPPLCC